MHWVPDASLHYQSRNHLLVSTASYNEGRIIPYSWNTDCAFQLAEGSGMQYAVCQAQTFAPLAKTYNISIAALAPRMMSLPV
jgi:hypothetical protein